MTVLDAIQRMVKSECDLSHNAASKTDMIFQSASQAATKLADDYPEIIPFVIRFLLPQPPASEPHAAMSSLGPGLQNPPVKRVLREADVNALVEPMLSSERYINLDK